MGQWNREDGCFDFAGYWGSLWLQRDPGEGLTGEEVGNAPRGDRNEDNLLERWLSGE